MNLIYPFAVPIALSLTAYNAFLTGLIVLLKRRDRAGFYYFVSSFVIAIWGVGITFMLNNEISPATAQVSGYFSQVVALFIPVTWLHFVVIYLKKEKQTRVALVAAYVVVFLLLPFTLSKSFILGFRPMVGFSQYPIPGVAYIVFSIFFAVVVVYAFVLFIQAIKCATGETKRDYRIICYASLYGFSTGSLAFLPVYNIPLPQYNLLVMPLWQILLTYAMIRHQAFDVENIAHAARKDKLAAIGTLATSINHEIRNPLYIVKGLAESHLANMKDGIYRDNDKALAKANEVLSKSVDQTARAMDIMKRFAMFAKQGVSQTAQLELVRLVDVMSDILPLVSHELELDKIKLIQNIPSGITLSVDRRHIEEIVFNLIVNACQAIKNDQRLETIDQQQSNFKTIKINADERKDSVEIQIEDNGPGISAEQLTKIFEPFYTTKQEGTGLGLYITKQLVERNGGKISVKSKPGHGTTFRLEFKP